MLSYAFVRNLLLFLEHNEQTMLTIDVNDSNSKTKLVWLQSECKLSSHISDAKTGQNLTPVEPKVFHFARLFWWFAIGVDCIRPDKHIKLRMALQFQFHIN